MYPITEGDTAVHALQNWHVSGNVIPHIWLKRITYDNGKPNLVAVMLLADIVYWYRPVEIRDESTGQFLGYGKKFKADKLQRSYRAFSDLFGFTKRQVRDNLALLEEMGLIDRELRTITTKSGKKASNVLYVGLNVEKLQNVTDVGVLRSNVIPYDVETSYPLTLERNTYTDITNTENTGNTKNGSGVELIAELVQQFTQLTGIFPNPGRYADDWERPLRVMLQHAADVEKCKRRLETAVRVARDKGYTIASPKSLTTIVANLPAEEEQHGVLEVSYR